MDVHAMVAETNLAGDIAYANDAFCAATGYSSEESLGGNPRVLNSGHHPLSFFKEPWDYDRLRDKLAL